MCDGKGDFAASRECDEEEEEEEVWVGPKVGLRGPRVGAPGSQAGNRVTVS